MSDQTQVQFQPNNERTAYAHGYGASPEQAYSSPDHGGRLPPIPPRELLQSEGPHDRDTALREKAEEKLRLQELVKSFAKRAVKGLDCELVIPETGSIEPARYFIEKDLKRFCVKAQGRPDESYPISQISDIIRVDEDST